MVPAEVSYLWEQILQHTMRFFKVDALGVLSQARVLFVSYKEALNIREPAVAIPVDIDSPLRPADPYKASFNGTEITLWNPLPKPQGEGWSAFPDAIVPVWYRHQTGTLIPAWNIFSNLFNLLTLKEERESTLRDVHGRFVAGMSPRYAPGLLEVPAFNEAVAVLVAACLGICKDGYPRFTLNNLIKPPAVILSHDNDILRGNDFWTQSVRFLRIFQPLIRGRMPNIKNIWWILRNTLHPKSFYLDNIAGIIDIERMLGVNSLFYFLNGTGGRFGARSGLELIPAARKHIPSGWDIGIHYNYDTLLDAERFSAQLRQLKSVTGGQIISGRAHYLRFDPEKSFSFLSSMGICCDETAGYSDCIGYRCGIAGPFQPYDPAAGKALNLWEVPLVIMDGTLMNQYCTKAPQVFRNMMSHISKVGGAISLLCHPGLFFNPEFSEMRGVYRRLFGVARDFNAQGMSALSIIGL